jgi:hypothetical protein
VGSSAAERAIRIATYGLLFVAGVLLGTIETFLVPQRLFGGVEGASALAAFAGNAIVGCLGGIGTRSLAGAAAPLLGWFVAVGVLTFVSFGGDVIVPGKLPSDPGIVVVGEAMLVFGLVGGAVGMFTTVYFTSRAKAPTSDA